jgi:hypothetical protein
MTVPSGCSIGLVGGAAASGTGAADSGGLTAGCAPAGKSQAAQQSIRTRSGREKTIYEKYRTARRKGCGIRLSPDGIIALHSLQGCQSCRIAKIPKSLCVARRRPGPKVWILNVIVRRVLRSNRSGVRISPGTQISSFALATRCLLRLGCRFPRACRYRFTSTSVFRCHCPSACRRAYPIPASCERIPSCSTSSCGPSALAAHETCRLSQICHGWAFYDLSLGYGKTLNIQYPSPRAAAR